MNLSRSTYYYQVKNRNTELKMIPKPNEQLKIRWESFLKRNKISNLKLSAVISKINKIIS